MLPAIISQPYRQGIRHRTVQSDSHPLSYGHVADPVSSTRSSWLREVMPSLVNTLLRWYWTVRALMNRRAPISEFDNPSRASCAT